MIDQHTTTTTTAEPLDDLNQLPIPTAGQQETPADDATQSERPAFLLEKFKTVEEQAQAYAELEKKLGETERNTEAPDEAEPSLPPLPAQLSKFSEEFAQRGSLSPESYAELEQNYGISRAYVDHYIAGVEAKQQDYVQAVKAETGGEEGFETVAIWARVNLPPADLAAVERALQSGDKGIATLAARGLYARYLDETGREPQLIGGGAPEGSGPQPFRSTAQVVEAMSDPRYAKDPDYRAAVEKRLAISSIL